MDLTDRLWLMKRAIIESVNDILMTVCFIDHTRHRSPFNTLYHLSVGLVAFCFLDENHTSPSQQIKSITIRAKTYEN